MPDRFSRRDRIRFGMIVLIALAAVLSVVGKKADSPLVGWVSFAAFAGAIFLYMGWRRTLAQERRARVFDREAKTDETRARADE